MALARTDEPVRRLRAAIESLAAEDVAGLVVEARIEARKRVRELLTEALAYQMIDGVEAHLAPARAAPAGASEAGRALDEQSSQEGSRLPDPSGRERPTAQQPVHEGPMGQSLQAPGRPTPQPAAGLTPQQQRRQQHEQRSPGPTDVGIYVYGVVPADTVLPTSLIGIAPVSGPSLLRHGRVAAVISGVPLEDFEEKRLREHLSDMAWVERTARAHEDVVERITSVATVIPMRMCSIHRDAAGVRKMLSREAHALDEALRHLEGKKEWAVKVFVSDDPKQQRAQGTDEADSTEQPASGTEYMRKRQSAHEERSRVDEELRAACVTIHEALTELAADAVTAALQRPEVSGQVGEMLLNGIYLVEAEIEDAFFQLVDQLRSEYESLGLEVEPTGPWPVYNFVPGTIGVAW